MRGKKLINVLPSILMPKRSWDSRIYFSTSDSNTRSLLFPLTRFIFCLRYQKRKKINKKASEEWIRTLARSFASLGYTNRNLFSLLSSIFAFILSHIRFLMKFLRRTHSARQCTRLQSAATRWVSDWCSRPTWAPGNMSIDGSFKASVSPSTTTNSHRVCFWSDEDDLWWKSGRKIFRQENFVVKKIERKIFLQLRIKIYRDGKIENEFFCKRKNLRVNFFCENDFIC